MKDKLAMIRLKCRCILKIVIRMYCEIQIKEYTDDTMYLYRILLQLNFAICIIDTKYSDMGGRYDFHEIILNRIHGSKLKQLYWLGFIIISTFGIWNNYCNALHLRIQHDKYFKTSLIGSLVKHVLRIIEGEQYWN